MKKILLVALILPLLGICSLAQAHTSINVGLGFYGAPAYYAPAPVYYAPAPSPAYYYPATPEVVYYSGVPYEVVYYGGYRHYVRYYGHPHYRY